MSRSLSLTVRTTIAVLILVMSNCWFGAYQSAKMLRSGEHSVEPMIETVSAEDLKDYYLRCGLRYAVGRDEVNHQFMLMADLPGLSDPDPYKLYTAQYGLKKGVREDKCALLFEFGVKSDLKLYTNGYFSFSPLFTVPISERTFFTVAPSLKMNIINVDHKLVSSPSFGIAFNCETGFSTIKIIPEISATYIYPVGFFVCSGVGIPIKFKSRASENHSSVDNTP